MKRSLIIVALIALLAALMVMVIGRRVPIVPEKPESGSIEEIFRHWNEADPSEGLSRSDTRTLLSTVQYLMDGNEEISIGSDASQGNKRRLMFFGTTTESGLESTIKFMCSRLIDCNDLAQKTVTGMTTPFISTLDVNGDGKVDDKAYSDQDLDELYIQLLSDTVSDFTKVSKTYRYIMSLFNGQTDDEINGQIIENWDVAWAEYQAKSKIGMRNVQNTMEFWTTIIDAIRRIEREKKTTEKASRRRLLVFQIAGVVIWIVALILLLLWLLTGIQFPKLLQWAGELACIGACVFMHADNCNC